MLQAGEATSALPAAQREMANPRAHVTRWPNTHAALILINAARVRGADFPKKEKG
jgi:hypothetical protein